MESEPREKPAYHLGLARATILTACSAIAFGLAFPPTSLRALAWVALAPFFLSLRDAGPRRALWLGWLWAVTAAYVTGDWLPGTVSNYFLQPTWVGIAFFFGVSSTMGAPYYMLFALVYRPLALRFGVRAPLWIAAAWAAAELARGRLLNGSFLYFGSTPWAISGYSQVGIDSVVQIASVAGVCGIGFALAASNAGIAEIARAWWGGRTTHRQIGIASALALLPAVLVIGFGFFALRAAPSPDSDADAFVNGRPEEAIEIALIQGNLDIGTRWRSDLYGKNLETYMRLTREALQTGSPQIVFWPESAMTFFVEREPLYRRALAHILYRYDAELVAGAPYSSGEEDEAQFHNSIYVISKLGEVQGRYDKQYLVPFTEYFPFARFDFLRRNFGRVREFTPGGPTPPLETRAGPAGILTCNEAMLPHLAGERVAQGAAYLVNPSNDTWSSDLKFSQQQFDIVALRAVEQRRYLVRASTTGPSAIVDPWGRVQVETNAFEGTFAHGYVLARDQRTVYSRVGDAFGVACVLATALGLALANRPASGGTDSSALGKPT